MSRARVDRSEVVAAGVMPVDFRHLSAFHRVYKERSYANAGQSIFATRKSIVRMMQNLERNFDCALFTEGLRGELVPGPFAERLFNDLRFLSAARHRMKDHISAIHENGRVLHVGSSPVLFRTRAFRDLFRSLQALDGIRACYMLVDSDEAVKALTSGHCDLYIGCRSDFAGRFVNQEAGSVLYRAYQRGAGPGTIPVVYQVGPVDRRKSESLAGGGIPPEWQSLDPSRWLYWLDHPEECPLGTVVLGPEVEMDQEYWCRRDDVPMTPLRQTMHACFLKQHAYEFLPALIGKVGKRILAA